MNKAAVSGQLDELVATARTSGYLKAVAEFGNWCADETTRSHDSRGISHTALLAQIRKMNDRDRAREQANAPIG
jgi:hypothetical protein